jgi:hypothetical protein
MNEEKAPKEETKVEEEVTQKGKKYDGGPIPKVTPSKQTKS